MMRQQRPHVSIVIVASTPNKRDTALADTHPVLSRPMPAITTHSRAPSRAPA